MSKAVDAARLEELSTGRSCASNLGEILQIDFGQLMRGLLPKADVGFFAKASIMQKMRGGGALLLQVGGIAMLEDLKTHASDTVRGWTVFALAEHYADAPVPVILSMVRPFAADSHWGVREWAWLAVRPHLVKNLSAAIDELQPWTGEADVNIRRFAVEALRPRGVWCKHIAELRQNPALGLPLLSPLRQEAEKYAQDSVANWLNDAAKDNPDWVQNLCQHWRKERPDSAATKRITKRALRSIT